MAEQISIDDIQVGRDLQAREAVDPAVVDDYAAALREGTDLPPVVVFFDGAAYYLADGFHRRLAAVRAGRATIAADVREGTRRDAMLHAVGANAQHGLRRSNADKRRAVMMLLDDPEWSQWSDREIARRCQVSRMTVGRLRPSVTSDIPERQPAENGGEVPRDERLKYKTPSGATAMRTVKRPAPPPVDLEPRDSEASRRQAEPAPDLTTTVSGPDDRQALRDVEPSPDPATTVPASPTPSALPDPDETHAEIFERAAAALGVDLVGDVEGAVEALQAFVDAKTVPNLPTKGSAMGLDGRELPERAQPWAARAQMLGRRLVYRLGLAQKAYGDLVRLMHAPTKDGRMSKRRFTQFTNLFNQDDQPLQFMIQEGSKADRLFRSLTTAVVETVPLMACPSCDGTGTRIRDGVPCPRCESTGVLGQELMKSSAVISAWKRSEK